VDRIRHLVGIIRKFSPGSVIIVDNCYGEFVEKEEPSQAGADIIAGSLIKNPGGGLAPCGGYIAGKSEHISRCEYRMTCPGLGREVGPSLGHTRDLVMGLFFAPHIVSESLKGSLFCCELAGSLGYKVIPDDIEDRTDIVQSIIFDSENELISFCQCIQKYSPVDSYVRPLPWSMPGYDDKVIMAAGTFTQGSSIELSCDAPLRSPYTAYLQGGLFYDHTRYAVVNAFKELSNRGK
jgi:cystathionine beta-lyase family protein involved in aluminum resistance